MGLNINQFYMPPVSPEAIHIGSFTFCGERAYFCGINIFFGTGYN